MDDNVHIGSSPVLPCVLRLGIKALRPVCAYTGQGRLYVTYLAFTVNGSPEKSQPESFLWNLGTLVEAVCIKVDMVDRVNEKWRRWGDELRRWRSLAKKTQAQLASLLNVAPVTVSAWERGTRIPNRDTAQAVDEKLGTGGVLDQLWCELTNSREIPEEWRDFAKLERQATAIRAYQPMVIPGLLQTREYARHIMLQWEPELDSDQVEHQVTSRTSRLDGLRRTALTFVLEEGVVGRQVGSADLMREQLDHILNVIDDHRIRVSVIPRHAPLRPLMTGSFRIMTLPDGRLVGHQELMRGVHVTTGTVEAGRMVSMFGSLQAEALSPGASADFIANLRKET
ncbi:transcriptional regulator with XRE-family HTH domain [Nocardiopsis mwathae]|uniref:Transcriptional regulator with XRE-family HTH domain n=1 Tax=Nocardiopsis mwathae TaxID=1472723 RepID=A0A7X0D4J7_9ACTN|nr:helix-turn-helix transcriptional regulator [Nocardiopsis mwathae]MBB6171377.1 transcriptional regulator with XRE-family HTH domain [Nocardiopsis mwathae]